MRVVGYAFLHRELGSKVFAPRLPARTAAVLRVIEQADHLAVPDHVAPEPGASNLAHLLFALKHEGVDLQILACSLPAIPKSEMLAALYNSPGGVMRREYGLKAIRASSGR